MSKTLGEQRVRVEFNPAKDGLVDQIKQKSAELINLCTQIALAYMEKNEQVSVTPGELGRLVSLASTSYEEAAMWAVKAATYGL